MNLLYRYSKQYWTLFIVALLLAATNQIFFPCSILVIFRHVIDKLRDQYHDYTQGQSFEERVTVVGGDGRGLRFARGEEFSGLLHQRYRAATGAKMFRTASGIRWICRIRFFEDQRSGETLGKLQKVRSDVERFITAAINVLFISVVGIVFVMVYAFRVHWSIAPAFFGYRAFTGIISSVLSRKIKKIQRRSSPRPPPWQDRRRSRCAISSW